MDFYHDHYCAYIYIYIHFLFSSGCSFFFCQSGFYFKSAKVNVLISISNASIL